MDVYLLIAFPLLIMLSGLFSSSETAFFSLSNFELSELEEKHPVRGRQVRRLLADQDILLTGILLGNLIVNICATAVATIILHRWGLRLGWSEHVVYLVDIVGMTFILLVLGEIGPKVYALGNARNLALRMSGLVRAWLSLTRPLILLLALLSGWVKRLTSRSSQDRQMLEDELKLMVDLTAEQGGLEQEEKQIIHNIFELSETTVREIMVPRTDIIGIPDGTPLPEVVKIIQESGHSRFPLFRDDLDDIVGILYTKDLLGPLYKFGPEQSLSALAHEVTYVPETKSCDDMLQEFQKRGIYMAIVVDEYGGTEGLVTVEDVMEEIIGEIQDEHDTEEPMIVWEAADRFLVDGLINIEDLSEELDVDLRGEGYETLGGFTLSRFGRLPHPGEFFDEQGYRFVISKLSRRRVWKVRIIRLPQPESQPRAGEGSGGSGEGNR